MLDDPTRYFEDLKRDLLSNPLVTDVRLAYAERPTLTTESRTYRVFLDSMPPDDIEELAELFETRLQTTTITTPAKQHDILVSDTFYGD